MPRAENIQTAAASTLSTYYVTQETDASCSLATATILINVLQTIQHPELPLASQQEVLAKVNDPMWTKACATGGDGTALDQFAGILKRACTVYNLQGITIEVVHVEKQDASSQKALHDILLKIASEKPAKTFLVVNFEQSMLIPTNVVVGHLSPIGDFRPDTARALVLDVDKDWTGPYWVDEKTLLKSMNTVDPDTTPRTYRGYIVLLIKP